MRIIVFGATGMVGQGALEACLRDDRVTDVLVIGRSPTERTHPKLREIHHEDFTDFTPVQAQLSGYDACLFCLGVSSVGMTEAAYRAITYDVTLAAAQALLAASPNLAFCYISGAGTDSSGKSRLMWARVKGETENALLAQSPRAYMFRPAFILPVRGIRAKTKTRSLLYRLMTALYPALRRLAPRQVTTSLHLGQAMIATAGTGTDHRVLTTADINEVATSRPPTP